MRLRVAALALAALLATGGTRPGGGVGATASQNRERVLGVLPLSIDSNVSFGNPAQFVLSAQAARAAGARHLYFFLTPNALATSTADTAMQYLTHPAAVTLSFFVTGGSGVQPSGIPASCVSDWTSTTCRTDMQALVRPFARAKLQSGDALLIGNEYQDFLDSAANIAANTALVLAIQEAVWSEVPGVYVGPVWSYNASDEAAMTVAWDSRFSFLCLNSYGENADFTVSDPIANGIAAVTAAETFATTLTNSFSICETGWPAAMTGAGATALGSNEAEQLTWATALRNYARASAARWIGVFLAVDGVLESDSSADMDDGTGAASSKCCEAAVDLGASDCTTTLLDTYICSLGLWEADGTEKDGWDALWGL